MAEEVPLVQTTSSTLGGLVNEEQVANLPLNGRNLIGLTLMQAGVQQTTVIPATTIGSGLSTGVAISNNGMPIHSNSYMLDGANMIEASDPASDAYGSAPRTPSHPNGVVSTFTGLASPRNISYHWNQPTDYQWNLASKEASNFGRNFSTF